jgi:hypothetical protein
MLVVRVADSDEEIRSFRAEADQTIAQRRWQKYCAAGDRHESSVDWMEEVTDEEYKSGPQ